jgi:hypothetical protein
MEYQYPKEFSKESRSRILAERIQAARAFKDAIREARGNWDVADFLRSGMLQVFLAFVREASALVRQATPNWSVDRLESESQEFLRRLIIDARYGDGFGDAPHKLPDMISHLNGSILPDVRGALEQSPMWREYEDILLEVAVATSISAAAGPGGPGDAAVSEQPAVRPVWEDLEISFISDQRVQVTFGGQRQTFNYAEMGFEDNRSGKPNQAWGILRALAQASGVLPEPARDANEFLRMGKRIERTRHLLMDHFHITSDPIPLEGGYHCRFKIGCDPSFYK